MFTALDTVEVILLRVHVCVWPFARVYLFTNTHLHTHAQSYWLTALLEAEHILRWKQNTFCDSRAAQPLGMDHVKLAL